MFLCKTCNKTQSIDFFYKNKICLSGYDTSRCKNCVKTLGKSRRDKPKSKKAKALYDAKRFQKNKDSIYEYRKKAPHEISYSRVWSRTRKDSVKVRTPSWANTKAIRNIYKECVEMCLETGEDFVVDHVIPLHGKLVSGFHVENNLEIVTKAYNSTKSNSYVSDFELPISKEYP